MSPTGRRHTLKTVKHEKPSARNATKSITSKNIANQDDIQEGKKEKVRKIDSSDSEDTDYSTSDSEKSDSIESVNRIAEILKPAKKRVAELLTLTLAPLRVTSRTARQSSSNTETVAVRGTLLAVRGSYLASSHPSLAVHGTHLAPEAPLLLRT